MEARLLFCLFLLVAGENLKNATTTPKSILEKDIELKKPINDSVQRSPVAYNQGSLLTPFPAVVRIKPKKKSAKALVEGSRKKKQGGIQEQELIDDVKKLVESLNHGKSRTGDPLEKSASGFGSSYTRGHQMGQERSYGNPYATGYQGLPQSQISSAFLGAITGSGKPGRNTFGSIDSVKGQATLSRAGTGTSGSFEKGDPYMTGHAMPKNEVPLGFGGYSQSNQQAQPKKETLRFGSYPAAGYYAGNAAGTYTPAPYSTTNYGDGQTSDYNQGYATASGAQVTDYSSQGYGTQGTSDYSAQGYGTPTDYSSQQPTNYGSQQPTNYGSQQPTNYGSEQSTSYGSEQSTNYGSEQSTNYGSEQSTNYGSEQSTNYGSEQSTNYGSQQTAQYGSVPVSTATVYGNQYGSTDYSNQGTYGQGATDYSSQGYTTGQTTDYNQGTYSQGAVDYSNQQYGSSAAQTTDYSNQGYSGVGSSYGTQGTYGQTTDYGTTGTSDTSGYGTPTTYGQTDYSSPTTSTDYNAGTLTDSYGTGYSGQTADYSNQGDSSTGTQYGTTSTDYGQSYGSSQAYGTGSSTDYGSQYGTSSSSGYDTQNANYGTQTGYGTATDYGSQSSGYNTEYSAQNYGSASSTDYGSQYGTSTSTDYSSQSNGYGTPTSGYSSSSSTDYGNQYGTSSSTDYGSQSSGYNTGYSTSTDYGSQYGTSTDYGSQTAYGAGTDYNTQSGYNTQNGYGTGSSTDYSGSNSDSSTGYGNQESTTNYGSSYGTSSTNYGSASSGQSNQDNYEGYRPSIEFELNVGYGSNRKKMSASSNTITNEADGYKKTA